MQRENDDLADLARPDQFSLTGGTRFATYTRGASSGQVPAPYQAQTETRPQQCRELEMVRDITFEGATRTITKGDRRTHPDTTTYHIAYLLFQNIGRLCSREMFLASMQNCTAGLKTLKIDAQIANVRALLQTLECAYEIIEMKDQGFLLQPDTTHRNAAHTTTAT